MFHIDRTCNSHVCARALDGWGTEKHTCWKQNLTPPTHTHKNTNQSHAFMHSNFFFKEWKLSVHEPGQRSPRHTRYTGCYSTAGHIVSHETWNIKKKKLREYSLQFYNLYAFSSRKSMCNCEKCVKSYLCCNITSQIWHHVIIHMHKLYNCVNTIVTTSVRNHFRIICSKSGA